MDESLYAYNRPETTHKYPKHFTDAWIFEIIWIFTKRIQYYNCLFLAGGIFCFLSFETGIQVMGLSEFRTLYSYDTVLKLLH